MTISQTIGQIQTNFSTNFDDYLWSHDFMVNTTKVNVSLIIANSAVEVVSVGTGGSDNVSTRSHSLGIDDNIHSNSTLFIVTTSITLAVLTICTLIGNILVIAAVLLERNLRTPANYLVLSLAVADFLVACLVMPLGAFYEIQGQWSLGDILCEFWISVDVLCCSASILHLLAIAVDRYWAVTNVDYIHQRNARRIGAMIFTIWFVAAIIALAPNFGWKDSQFKNRIKVEKRCLVSQNIGYQTFATVATFYAPLIFILVLYWKIYKVARKRIRRKPGSKIEVKTSETDKPFVLNSPPEPVSPMSPKSIQNFATTELNQMNVRLTIQTKAQPSVSISDRSTSTTCTSTTNNMNNHSPPINAKPIPLLRSKSNLKQSLNSKREKKAAKTLAIVTGVFVICWAPFFILAILMPYCSSCSPPLLLISVFLWLGYVNSYVKSDAKYI